MVKISTVARRSGLNYHTVRKYLMALQKQGIQLPEDQLVEMVKKIKNLTAQGYTVHQAIQRILEKEDKSVEEMFAVLLKRISDLEHQNKQLSDLLQVYLSRINKLEEKIQALPQPRKSLWQRIKDLLSHFKIHRER